MMSIRRLFTLACLWAAIALTSSSAQTTPKDLPPDYIKTVQNAMRTFAARDLFPLQAASTRLIWSVSVSARVSLALA